MPDIQEPISLAALLRPVPLLGPEDSVSRALYLLRGGCDTLPVVDAYGRLQGVVTLADLRPLLADDAALLRLHGPALAFARRPARVGDPAMSPDQVRVALRESGETSLVILDRAGRFLGIVSLTDLLEPTPVAPRPASVGGMATPWGVYLTSGTLQAGAGNGALVASGMVLGLTLALSHVGLGLATWAAQHLLGLPLYALWNAPQPARVTVHTIGWFALQALALPLFLVLLRLLPLSGYHAAEHQAVHAMERGEPLVPEILRRMPRVHPRCGTNIMAAGLVFGLISQAIPALHLWGMDATDGAVLGAIAALFTWRSVGAFLQQYFTTRPANDRQLAAGIAAAEDLERKFLRATPQRPTLLRRLWCMGMPQTMLGVMLGSSAVLYLGDWLLHVLK